MTTLDHWQAMFDAWAGQDPFVASTGEPSNPEEMASVGLVLGEWMQLDGSQRVLDVGCASGTLTGMWASEADEVVGVDFSRALLADAERSHAGTNMTFVHAEAATLPFDDAQFDCVCTYAMMLCLPDHDYVEQALDEILRVARPDARIVIGGLPDSRCRDVFFDHCDAMTPWYRRAVPRPMRWAAKRILKPGSTPGETVILWFDVQAIAERMRERGFSVAIEHDPELSNYAVYRKTLVLSRGTRGTEETRV
jgi:ubiquinone/menaquinone biosynthesis C-methylase UbiE